MARVDAPVGFRGGLARWVEREEARTVVLELAGISTCGQLVGWLESTAAAGLGSAGAVFEYRARLGALEEPVEGAAVARSLIVREAALRRLAAIRDHARANRLQVSAAVGTDQSGRSLARCPACDAPLDASAAASGGHFYCAVHRVEEDADLDELLDATTTRRRR
jgi:hypothetical protein